MLTSLQKHLPAGVPVTRRACHGVLDAEPVLHSHAYMTALVTGLVISPDQAHDLQACQPPSGHGRLALRLGEIGRHLAHGQRSSHDRQECPLFY